MTSLQKLKLTRGAAIRMCADALLLQVALISALAVRFYFVVNFENADGIPVAQLLNMYQSWYVNTAAPLTLFCLAIFYSTGFYTRGQYYQSRYKVLVVTQAVTASFLVYFFLVFFFNVYDGKLSFARWAFVLAWAFAIVLLGGARIWNQLWRAATHTELHPVNPGRDIPQVLVIGGGGYIGSALVPRLLKAGYRVRVLDILLFGESPLDGVRDHENLELIQGDFRHVEKVVESMRNVDAVVHLGAIVGDPACSLDEDLTIDINLSATRMIADLAKTSGISRFVFASTCSVYGACDEILDERSEVRPVSLYGNTKLASERLLQDLACDGFAPTILRFATIYGLSGRTRFDLVVNLLTAKAKLDGEITIFDGEQWRPFVHVEDAARAIVAVLDAPESLVANEIFNVGSSEQNFRIREIGEMVHQQVISATIVHSSTAQDHRNYRVDFHKIRNLLNYSPEWTVQDGIQQVLEAIASGRITDYRDPQYSNVMFLSKEGTAGLARDKWARQLIDDLTQR